MTWIYILIAIGIGVIILVNGMTILSINKMSKPDSLYVLAGGLDSVRQNETFREAFLWTEANGFTPDVLMELEGPIEYAVITVGIWRNDAVKTMLACYVSPDTINHEFTSTLSRECSLDTSSTKDGAMLPGLDTCYRQFFHGMELDSLFQKHLEGLQYLKQHRGLESVLRTQPTDILVQQAVNEQIAYVKSLPLWQLRGAYWFFVRRNSLNNKTIAQQYPH